MIDSIGGYFAELKGDKMNNAAYASWVDLEDVDLIHTIDLIAQSRLEPSNKLRLVIRSLLECVYDIEFDLELLPTDEAVTLLNTLLVDITPSLFMENADDELAKHRNNFKLYKGICKVIDSMLVSSRSSFHKYYWRDVSVALNKINNCVMDE